MLSYFPNKRGKPYWQICVTVPPLPRERGGERGEGERTSDKRVFYFPTHSKKTIKIKNKDVEVIDELIVNGTVTTYDHKADSTMEFTCDIFKQEKGFFDKRVGRSSMEEPFRQHVCFEDSKNWDISLLSSLLIHSTMKFLNNSEELAIIRSLQTLRNTAYAHLGNSHACSEEDLVFIHLYEYSYICVRTIYIMISYIHAGQSLQGTREIHYRISQCPT
jgi:hypothetical protein